MFKNALEKYVVGSPPPKKFRGAPSVTVVDRGREFLTAEVLARFQRRRIAFRYRGLTMSHPK